MKSLKTKTCFIDLDGTLYSGDQLIDGALDFMSYLQRERIPYYFITNNATRTHAQNAQKLRDMGFQNIRDEDFFTSAMASAAYVAHHSDKRRAYYIGQDGMREALEEQGFTIDDQQADYVFIGLDTTATYASYCKAFELLQKGAKLVGTNGDRRLPHGDSFHIGNGAVVAMFAYASEQEPIMVGKPCEAMMQEALRFAGIKKSECVMIGDNLETDILFGIQQGVETVFVTSGVHRREDAKLMQLRPDVTIDCLSELIEE